MLVRRPRSGAAAALAFFLLGAAPAELVGAVQAAAVAAPSPRRTVVLLLFDGFAPSMVDGHPTPNLDRMRREGAWTHRLVPAFPSVSLVNGFTLSTGCWPERHGIVSNRFLDPERGLYDHSRDADWLIGCELLHAAAERQGVRTAALAWFGAFSSSRGRLSSIAEPPGGWKDYPPDPERARDVADLLALPEAERPGLLLAYFLGPDDPAHFEGLGSRELAEAVAASDRAIGIVLHAVDEARAQGREVTLLVTTDHGMVPVSHLVNLRRLLRRHGIEGRVTASGTVAFLYLDDPSRTAEVSAALASYSQLEVFRPEGQPEWARIGTGPRVGDLVISARPPHFIEDPGSWPWYLRWLAPLAPAFPCATPFFEASHGYPPHRVAGVHGILYAWGSGIARGREAGEVRAVDVHPTAARLLGIEPGAPLDGRVAEELLGAD